MLVISEEIEFYAEEPAGSKYLRKEYAGQI